MQIDFSYRETWLHRGNPALKLLLFVILFVYAMFVHNLDTLVYMTVFHFILLFSFSGHPLRRLLLYMSPFLLIFVSSAVSMALFGKGTTLWFEWGLVSVTKESFLRGIHLGFRALDFAVLGLTFALTTRPVYLFYSLMQQAKLPPKYAYSFMASIRLIPLLLEELQTLRYALKVRGMRRQRGIGGFYRKLKAYAVPLLAQSIRKAQRIAVAMEAKRFSEAKKRTYYYELSVSRIDALAIVAYAAIAAAAIGLSVYAPVFHMTDVRMIG
ncbi:energy-coupling factor transporter transmembrane component T family protein [Paenibacillus contaminans]|uniref:Energy-coupling factor transporter transmembrane protein EcfT n=1 Tax=Paenibacillus contaminans TaxID=450362 RepID=A0A329MTV1_9BACL|nr:energy-coupling factor transporter transmembrane component T [Paenibacillus contaminans]RAV22133.1 energy-coupling factor transporter transmembrane protein EcfT [Paenibacillus contaminans]